jgi:acetolactate synthase-1/2/3 large subunit
MRHLLAGCERCAGYMADGYVRFSDRLAACYAPGGIGSPQLLSPLLEARNSSIPLLFISISQPISDRGRWATSSFDHAAFDEVAKANIRVERVDAIPERVVEAVRIATSPRTGPCHLDIPSDILSENTTRTAPMRGTGTEARYPRFRPRADGATIRRVDALMRGARCPVIVLGGGVHLAHLPTHSILRAAERYGAALCATLNGKGGVPETEGTTPFVGVVGQKGDHGANEFIRQADVVVLLGTKMGDKSSLNGHLLSDSQTVVQVDVDPRELGRVARVTEAVLSDARAFIEDLLAIGSANPRRTSAGAPMTRARDVTAPAAQICTALSMRLRGDDILVADASQASGWMGVYFRGSLRGRGTTTPRGTGTIGYALPAAIGAWLARPGAQVAALGGDGGLLMSMHEMETATRLRANVKFFLLNNGNRLGLLEEHLRHLHGAADVLGVRSPIDWRAIAEGFSWQYARVTEGADVAAHADHALSCSGPMLVDVACDATLSPDFENTLRLAALT